MVRQRTRRPALHGFRHQRGATQTWHTLTGRQHFFLDHDWMSRSGRTCPPSAPTEHASHLRRSEQWRRRQVTVRYLTPTPSGPSTPSIQDNLFMLSLVARRARDLDESAGCRQDRCQGQRVDRGLQPQRRRGSQIHRLAPDARRPSTCITRRTARWTFRGPRPPGSGRHSQLADPPDDQTDAHHRRLRAAVVHVQLPRTDG